MEPPSQMMSNDYGSELLYRILFISLTVNLCVAIRLSLTGAIQSLKLCRRKKLVEELRDLSSKEKDIIHIVSNEVVNILLSSLALACVCMYPIQHYTHSRPPMLLEILIACDCGRYFYKIGLLVSWKRRRVDSKEGESVFYNCFKLFYLVPALLFYGYILASNDLWWIGVIGNFIEMESIVTSIHSVLKRVYAGYDTVDVWCKWIQAVSVLCIRFILPLILYHLFNNQQKYMEECTSATRIVLGITYFYVGGYNLAVLFIKFEQICERYKDRSSSLPVQVIQKLPVPHIEINDIFGDSEKAKASKLSVTHSVDSAVFSEKQPTWSMVGMEDLSPRNSNICPPNLGLNSKDQPRKIKGPHSTSCAPKTEGNSLNNTTKSKAKRVRFAFEQLEDLCSLKPTSNLNTDTSDANKPNDGYGKLPIACSLLVSR